MASENSHGEKGRPRYVLRSIGIVLGACVLLVGSGMVGPATAQEGPTERFVVAVHADGSATVSVTYTFDLTSASERDAFRSLMNDERTRADAKARFRSRMRAIANATEDATGREMAVTGVSIHLATTPDNETGMVTLSVMWEGLAVERDGRLRVREPFASEFTPERRFVLRAPDGYRIVEATPPPTTGNETRAVWAAGSSLDGFEVVMAARTPTPTPSPSPTQSPTPSPSPAPEQGERTETATPGQSGFGVVIGGLAVVIAAALIARE